MEDETSEELTSDSEYSDSFIATDDELEELTWFSEESRPAGPSPDSELEFPEELGRELRNRPIRRRRVVLLPDSTSENSSQASVAILSVSSPDRSESPQNNSSQDSDSDETISDIMALISPTRQSPPVSPPPAPPALDNQPQSPRQLGAGGNEVIEIPPVIEPEVIEVPYSPQAEPPSENLAAHAPVEPDLKPVESQLDCSVLSESEDSSLCTICMCPLTNSGSHRVVCLRCGHIFGQSCVERWIKVGCNNGARRCPTCNKKATLKDVRVLFLPKVVPLDTSERDRLIQEKEELVAQKKMLESDFTRTVLQHKLVVVRYEERIAALEKRLQEKSPSEGSLASLSQVSGLKAVCTVTISHDGGCRVMAFNRLRQELVVSQPSGNTVFAGFGVRVLNSVDWQPSRFVLLHSKAVRDLQFHSEDKDMLLSVSLDQNAKLFDLGANTTVHTFKGEGPLWSCSWDVSHPHLLLLGTQSGKVVQYDRRMTDHCVNMWEMDNNKTPVVSLASTPCRAGTPFPLGGFLSCRLNSVFSYARHAEVHSCQGLAVEGPFMSMRYDSSTQMMLTSSRPSSRSPHTRVCLSLLDADSDGMVCAMPIHTFNSGSSARVMSRSTILPHVDDSLVVAHNESGRTLDLWSSKSGDHLYSVPVREPIIDLTPATVCRDKPPLMAALSEKTVTLYKVN